MKGYERGEAGVFSNPMFHSSYDLAVDSLRISLGPPSTCLLGGGHKSKPKGGSGRVLGPRKEASDFLWVCPNVALWNTPWGWGHTAQSSPGHPYSPLPGSSTHRMSVPRFLSSWSARGFGRSFFPSYHRACLSWRSAPACLPTRPRVDT